MDLKSHNLLEAMQGAPEGVILWDADGRLILCNDRMKELYEPFAKIMVPGLKIEDLLHQLKAAGVTRVVESNSADQKTDAIESSNWEDVNLVLNRRESGLDVIVQYRNKWIQVRRKKLADGSIIAFHTDITDIKIANEKLVESREQLLLRESQLSNAQDLVNLGYFEHDLITGIHFWSEILCRIFGVKFGLDRELEDYLALVHPEDRDHIKEVIEKNVIAAENYNSEHRIVRPDGEERTIRNSVKYVVNEKNERLKRIGVVVDITEERLREDQLRQANQAKSDFLTHMSHEFRTPLNSILGFAQVIENDKKNVIDETNRHRIQNILKSSNHLLYLVDDLLDLGRIEAGNISVELKPLNSVEVFKDAIAAVETIANDKKISLNCNLPADSVPLVKGDDGRLKQIFLNLLSNAIKYNQEGGEINASFQILENDLLRINVQDTGVGIDPDRLELIFKPFNRDWALSPQISGSGIGLSISKQLAELMGGSIGVTSKKGIGSTFWIELEIAENTIIENTIQKPPLNAGQISLDVVDGVSKQVLYIDDDANSLTLMQDIFEDIGFANLTISDDAIKGLKIAKDNELDLVILDINLPTMTGLEILEKLKENENTKNIPIFAISADALPVHVQNGLDHGFDLYLSKPIILSELLGAVEEYLA